MKKHAINYMDVSIKTDDRITSFSGNGLVMDHMNEDDCIMWFNGSIKGFIEDDEVTIGSFCGYCIPMAFFDDDVELFEMACDSISQDLYEFSESARIKENIEVLSKFSNVIYIDRLFIEEEFRGQGIGHVVLDNLDSIFYQNLFIDAEAVVLKPVPQEKDPYGEIVDYSGKNKKDKINSLMNFYDDAGFIPLIKSNHLIKYY